MIDIYIDDVKFEKINDTTGEELQLVFKNNKDDKISLVLKEEELKKLYISIKNRCEIRGLIPIKN